MGTFRLLRQRLIALIALLILSLFVTAEARAACSDFVAPFDSVCTWISQTKTKIDDLYDDLTDWMDPYFGKVEAIYNNSERMLQGFETTLTQVPEAIAGVSEETFDHIKSGYEMVNFFLLQQEEDYEQFVSSCDSGRCADFKVGIRTLVDDIEQLAREEQALLASTFLPPDISFPPGNTLGDFFNNLPTVPSVEIDLTIIKSFLSEDVPDFMYYPLEKATAAVDFARQFPAYCETNDRACNNIYAISDVLAFTGQAFEAVETLFVGTCAEIYAQQDYIPVYNYAGNFLIGSGWVLQKLGDMNRTAADISIKGVDAGASVGAEVTVTTDIKVQSALGKVLSSLGKGAGTIGGFAKNKLSDCRQIMNQQVLMCVIINADNKKRTDEYTECMNEVLDVTSPNYSKYGF